MATSAAGTALQLRTAQWPSAQLALPRIGGVSQSMVAGSRTQQQRGAVRCSNSDGGATDAKAKVIPGEEELLKTEAPLPAPPAPHAEAAPETAASAFLSDVANLIKLVDSRDIVELELKHLDYELLVRKKEALPPPPAPVSQVQASFPGPHIMGHTPYPYGPPPPPPPPAAEVSKPVEQIVKAAPAEAPAPNPPSPSLPAMLSPMAGTFYRSPGPGEPAFVKIGDKIQKGQVICIVEAMKLMNEIEADQSGTLLEIVAEDGKPVSIESPLFVIKP